jgi:hypothetical protein
MRDLIYFVVVLLLGGTFVWSLRSGFAGWVWWERRLIYRDRDPFAYWVLTTIHFVVFIYFVIKGRHMPLR